MLSPLEYLLRYNVLIGMLVSAIGVAICIMAKKITLKKRNSNELQNNDKLYFTLMMVGFGLILAGMIITVLPFEATFYSVG